MTRVQGWDRIIRLPKQGNRVLHALFSRELRLNHCDFAANLVRARCFLGVKTSEINTRLP